MKNCHRRELWDENALKSVPNPDFISGCRRTYLIQRLMPPREGTASESGFGAGLARGGFTPDAWEYMMRFCRFPRMGSAEFEDGSVPETFQRLHLDDSLEAFAVPVLGHPDILTPNMLRRYDRFLLQAVASKHVLDKTIFAIGPRAIRPHMEDIILQISIDERCLKLREPTLLRSMVFSCPEWVGTDREFWDRDRTCGWLELDNPFMFFSESGMWAAFCGMFGITVPSHADVSPDFSEINSEIRELTPKSTA